MYLIKGVDLFRAVQFIDRLPDSYVKNGNLYDGLYKDLSVLELLILHDVGIEADGRPIGKIRDCLLYTDFAFRLYKYINVSRETIGGNNEKSI